MKNKNMIRSSLSTIAAMALIFVTPALGQDESAGGPTTASPEQPTALTAQAEGVTVPRLVTFSGVLKDASGKPMTGTATVAFSVYEFQEGGSPLWVETQAVRADAQGRYTVLLGATQADGLPLDLFITGKARWVGVQPQLPATPEQPRVLLVGVPYALKAADADTLGGKPASAFMLAGSELAAQTQGAVSASGGAAAGASQNAVASRSTADKSGSSAVSSPLATACASITADGTATANQVAKFTASCKIHQSRIFDNGTNVGIGTTTPAAALDVSAPNQVGMFVRGPFSGVGAGLDLLSTGTGGKQWEILATGAKSAQGPGKLNIRNINDGRDVFFIDTFDGTNVLGLNAAGQIVDQGNLFVNGATVMGSFGMTSQGPVGIGTGKAFPLAPLDVLGNNQHTLVGGAPGCNTGFSGVGFGTAGLSDCAHYSLLGDGHNTFINRPSGGAILFREGNADQMNIQPGGNVGIGTLAPQEKLDVAGRVRSQNVAAVATQSTLVDASSSDCLGALLSANSACDTPNLALTETTGNVPAFIIANLQGIFIDACVVANFALVTDGNIVTASNMQTVPGNFGGLHSLTMVSLQFPAPGTHTFEVQESDDTGGCSGGTSTRTEVGWPSGTSSNFSTRTLIVREF